MKTIEPHFIVTDVLLINRKKRVIKHEINVATWGDPNAEPIINKIKSENIVLVVKLTSSGNTKRIDTMSIISTIMNKLNGHIL
jgi:hypothetical protein